MQFPKILKRGQKDEHEEILNKLNDQEEKLRDHARRLRALELERGIYKPPVLKEVIGD